MPAILDRDITDEDIEKLVDEAAIGENLQKAEVKRKGLSNEQIHTLRARCKRDLFFLCYSVLGYTRLSTNLHGNLCTHVRNTQYKRFREYLLARGNFKSTILTIGHSIQTVLPYTTTDREHDEDTTELGWPYNLGTDCRVLIAHETHEMASRFLYAITSHFTSNPLLMGLFPETVPSARKNRINKWELELPRKTSGNPEPTIDTIGVGAKSQGRHYNYIKLDDIFGDKARDSATESETTRDWFDNVQSFFSYFSKDHLDLIGTRWSFDDIYSHAEERYGSQLLKYSRKIEEFNPKTGQKEITFPEEFSKESLEILRKNRKVFSAQYLNDPDEDGAGFPAGDRHLFYWTSTTTIAVFDGERKTEIHIRDLDIVILIDPGVSKSGGFAVTGTDHLNRTFVLVAIRLEMKPPEFVELLFKQVIRWQPRTVAIESDIFASVYQFWLMREMSVRGIRFHITPVTTKKREKNDRIAGLTPYMAGKQLLTNEKQEDLQREIRVWGKSKDIHILDALAYGPELWRPGFVPGTRGNTELARQSIEDDRDIETGYGVYDPEYGT